MICPDHHRELEVIAVDQLKLRENLYCSVDGPEDGEIDVPLTSKNSESKDASYVPSLASQKP